MITIRLARSGVKKRPFYHISVADSRRARDGKFIERVGFFNPIASGKEVRLEINQERIDYWVSKGAQPSDRVIALINENKESPEEAEKRLASKEKKKLRKLEAKKVAKESNKKEEPAEEAPAEEAAPEEAPVEEATPEEAPAEEAAPEEAAPEEAPSKEDSKENKDS